MQRWRWGIAVAIVAALAVIVVLSLGADNTLPTTTQVAAATTSTTTTAAIPTTTSTVETTSTTTEEQRLAEVEQILQELWFGWFDAIYRKDPDALWKVVATTRFHDDGVAAMDSMEFVEGPELDAVLISDSTVLLDRVDCLVVDHSIDVVAFRGSGAVTQTVSVMWPDSRYGWRFATDWQSANDLWQMDCDNMQREQTP